MNHKVLHTLEFDKITALLTEYAFTESAKKKCSNLKPSYDLGKINELQDETSAALGRILRHGDLSFSGIYDLHSAMKRLEIGGVINMVELINFAKLLDVARRVKSYDRNERTDEGYNDVLSPYFEALCTLPEVSDEINRCIIGENEVADDATPTLKSIRRQMKTLNDRIHTELNSMITSQSSDKVLQDNIVTMRNGRYCLSVKAEAKSKVVGMVHDQSSSGQTYFIEPMAVVKLNNELTELELKEQKEIQVILANLSNLCGEHIEELRDNFRSLTKLDFIFARGMLAKKLNAMRPSFNVNGIINLKKAYHPLLNSPSIVPIDVTLGKDFDLLVVTGPNTGGKTVSLKTVGLLTLMGQAGLHIPAGDRSELALFKEVLVKWQLTPYVKINESDFRIRFQNGSEIIMTGLDEETKLLSLANISMVWVEEAYEVEKEKVEQLNLRMRGTAANQQIIMSYNPISKNHWLYDFC